jgi:hypothetical protein
LYAAARPEVLTVEVGGSVGGEACEEQGGGRPADRRRPTAVVVAVLI